MKKYPKKVVSDIRGQLVIPKEVRDELSIEEGTAFWAFVMGKEGILLKRASGEKLGQHDLLVVELSENSGKIMLDKEGIEQSVEQYKKRKKTAMEEI